MSQGFPWPPTWLLPQFTEEEVEVQPGWTVGGTEGGPGHQLACMLVEEEDRDSLPLPEVTLLLPSFHLVHFTVKLGYLIHVDPCECLRRPVD